LSGAHQLHKGDVLSKDFLVEAKFTGKKQISIKSSVMNKIGYEAYDKGRYPAMAISLEGLDPMFDKDWIMVEAKTFKRLIEGEI